MKFGFSVLLGEHMAAASVAHKDCEYFQIVCPSCKEPVFKVERQTIKQTLHYLSHYRKDASYDEECNLRVDSMTKEELDNTNSTSRGQRLEFFLRVFQDELLDHFFPRSPTRPDDQEKIRRFFRIMDSNPAINNIKVAFFENFRSEFARVDESVFSLFAADYVEDVTEVSKNAFPKTTFSLDAQTRIAHDMLMALCAKKAERNLGFLFDHCYCYLTERIGLASRQRDLFDWERQLGLGMVALPSASGSKQKSIISGFLHTLVHPPYSVETMPLLQKMCGEISHEMIGCLLVMPWFEILRRGFLSSAAQASRNTDS